MGFSNALTTSLSGMYVNSESLTVTGNNIANVNTTAFKSSRMYFETEISKTMGAGSAPTANMGGTNPSQIGLGVRIGNVARDFSTGSLSPTGVNTHLAIEGDGFFMVNQGGNVRYTRSGNFMLDRGSNLVTPDGGLVMGYGVDENFNVITGVQRPINIPVGSLTLAEATQTVVFDGVLRAGEQAEPAQFGTQIHFPPLVDSGGNTITDPTALLTTLFDDGAALFQAGDVITLAGVTKGGASIPNHTFEILANSGDTPQTFSEASGATIEEFMDFLNDVLGIDEAVNGGYQPNLNITEADPVGTPGEPLGVRLGGVGETDLDGNSVEGMIVINGNAGTANHIELSSASIIVNQGGGGASDGEVSIPFQYLNDKIETVRDADGESVRTTFVAYDSLGSELLLDLTVVLEETPNTGDVWRFYVQSTDDTDMDRVLGNGELMFDTEGQLKAIANNQFTIDRNETGADTPQQITLEFENGDGAVASLETSVSQIISVAQDGSPIGTLTDFSISDTGEIVGVFSNSMLRTLGQLILARFANPNGLVEEGGNLYNVTINSGLAATVVPGTSGAGKIIGGALELSNVDLSKEFVDLITASTGFTANSRVMTTADRLIQELLNVVR